MPFVVLGELHADALGAVVLCTGGVIHTTCGYRQLGRVVHQCQQHEDFVAELVRARGGDEQAAAVDEAHVGGVQRRFSLIDKDITPALALVGAAVDAGSCAIVVVCSG